MGGDDCTANESRRLYNAGCQGAGKRGAKSVIAPLRAVGLCPNDSFLFKTKSTKFLPSVWEDRRVLGMLFSSKPEGGGLLSERCQDPIHAQRLLLPCFSPALFLLQPLCTAMRV